MKTLIAFLQKLLAHEIERTALQHDRQRMVGLIYLIMFATGVLGGCVMDFYDTNSFRSLLMMGLVSLVGWLLNRAGHEKSSAVLLIVTMVSVIQYNIYSGFGIHDVTIIAWPAFIFFVGLLFGSWTIPYAMALVGILAVVTVVIPHVPIASGYAETGDLIVMLLVLLAFSIIARLILRRNEQSIQRSRRSEERFQTIYHSLNDALVIQDAYSGAILDVNEKMLEMFGCTSREALDLANIFAISSGIPPYTQDNGLEWLRKTAFQGAQHFEWQVKDKSGRLFWVDVNMKRVSIDGQAQVLVSVREITERKQAEAALRQSEARYRGLFNHASLAVFQSGLDGEILAVNPEFARIFGFASPAEVLASIPNASGIFVDPKRREEIIRLRVEHPELTTFENWYRRKDGSSFLGKLNVRQALDAENRLLYFEGFIEDITERKRAEETLQESENMLRRAQQIAQIGHFKFTPATGLVEGSDELFRIFGLTREQSQFSHFVNSVHPEDRDSDLAFIESALLLKTSYEREHRLLLPDGTLKWICMIGTLATTLPHEPIQVIGTIQDVTDRKHAELQQEVLYQVLRAVSSQLDADVVVRSAVETIVRLTGYPHVCITLPDENGSHWVVRGAAGILAAELGASYPLQQGVIGRMFTSGETQWVRDILEDPNYVREVSASAAPALRSELVVPIRRGDHLLGALNVESDHVDAFEDADTKMIQSVADVIALALHNARLYREAQQDILERKHAEEALKRSEQKFARAFRSSPDLIVLTSLADGRIVEVNDRLQKMTGYTRDEIIGRTTSEIQMWLDPFQRDQYVTHLSTYGYVHDREVRLRFKSGKILDTLISGEIIELQDGKYILGTIRDITERKMAEAALRDSEARYRLIAENTPDVIWVLSLVTGEFTYVSPSVQKQRGYTPAEVLTQSLSDVVTPASLSRLQGKLAQRLAAFTAGDTSVLMMIEEVDQIRKDGTVISTEVVTNFVIDDQGTPIEIVGVSRDISERKRAEEDRIAREIAERANRAKSEFLSRMSHELRTPLNAILGFTQLLQMDGLGTDQQHSLDQIYKSGRHLLNLVNEVLNFARIEAGRMHISLEAVRLEDTVTEALELIRPLAEARSLSLSLDMPSSSEIFVQADRQGFRQVLLNLLSNAVKYNRVGGEIELTANLTSDGHLRLNVRDTGEGIPPEKIQRLFVAFDRLGRDLIEQEGTGLGLALSKGLVEAMGGCIGVQSQPGEGSVFWVELKLATETLPETILAEEGQDLPDRLGSGRLAEQSGSERKPLVLYVEDNLANLNLVEAVMERLRQVELITAMYGRLALDLAVECHPDLILLDLHLPDMHGSDVLSGLKSEPATQSIPVILLTADARPEATVDLLAPLGGARSYLTKPIDIQEFLNVVREFLG